MVFQRSVTALVPVAGIDRALSPKASDDLGIETPMLVSTSVRKISRRDTIPENIGVYGHRNRRLSSMLPGGVFKEGHGGGGDDGPKTKGLRALYTITIH